MADFIVRLLHRVDMLNATTFAPDKGAQDDFNHQVEEFMRDAVWTGKCSSWCKFYPLHLRSQNTAKRRALLTQVTTDKKGQSGKVTAVWPGSSLHYQEVLGQNRWEDWNWTYPKRRYSIWGKGQSAIERSGSDYSYYLQHGPLLKA